MMRSSPETVALQQMLLSHDVSQTTAAIDDALGMSGSVTQLSVTPQRLRMILKREPSVASSIVHESS
jgi:hypothetical protein